VVSARAVIGGIARTVATRWRGIEVRVEHIATAAGAWVAGLAGVRHWRPRWWGPAVRWWASSRARSAAAWWLAALDGCLERAHARLPGWWPERLTSVLLLAGLVAADVEAWRWLPW
jgi:hypothetical protein